MSSLRFSKQCFDSPAPRFRFALALLAALGLAAAVADDDPRASLRQFHVAPGLKLDLFAAEPDVRNPVSLAFDEQGRCFVVETMRRRSSAPDIRWHPEWLDADFSFRTVEQRAAFLKLEVVPENEATIRSLTAPRQNGFQDFNGDGVFDWRDLEVQSERIRLLVDTDGDGVADRAAVFADGFNSIVSGVAAGVLPRHGEVYFACIPDLWRITSPGLQTTNRWPEMKLPLRPEVKPTALDRSSDDRRAHGSEDRHQEAVRPLLSGFGVHIGSGGHDMHGLIFGPDGKLYWSIADRGTGTNLFASVHGRWPGLTPELLADSGCVFRCEPDGSELEVFACGLRNPQELAFDECGNLFTADNNADYGDKARWHYVVEGADFGWRVGWQWMDAKAYQPKLGPWNAERLWELGVSNTALYLPRPLAHIGHGPAGLAYNPGTGLPPAFDRHFFLCDFPGAVLMWTNIPAGASFRIGPVQSLFGDSGPTDVAFGVDGGVYVTDWLKSFEKPEKGRIYRIHDPATDRGAAVLETKRLLGDGMSRRSVDELIGLLGHADMRVRLEAQFALAKEKNFKALRAVAFKNRNRVARLHALWAISRIAHDLPIWMFVEELSGMRALLRDGDEEVRGQAARLLGQGGLSSAQKDLEVLLHDPSPRVRFHAMMALREMPWHLGRVAGSRYQASSLEQAATKADEVLGTRLTPPRSTPVPFRELLDFARATDPADDYARHAVVLALAERERDFADLTAGYPRFAQQQPFSVRLAGLLAGRRTGAAWVSRFLHDPDPRLVLEAARAIYDVPIPAGLPALAGMVDPAARPREASDLWPSSDGRPDSTIPGTAAVAELKTFALRRALNANYHLGGGTNAEALAKFAARAESPELLRVEALELLGAWPKPPGRDSFLGVWRPLPARDPGVAAAALQPLVGALLRDGAKAVTLAALRAAVALPVAELDLFGVFADGQRPAEVRSEALQALVKRNDPKRAQALDLALADRDEALRIVARRLQSEAGDTGAATRLGDVLDRGSLAEQQAALAALRAEDATTEPLLLRQLDRLLAGTLAPELELELLETAAKSRNDAVQARLAKYAAGRPKDNPLAPYHAVLHGGNAEIGRNIFLGNPQVACLRCHKIKGEGGEVGPDLAGLGQRQTREYILESILFPNRSIAPGFESVLVELKNGATYAGLVKSENDQELVLNSPEDGLLKLKKADIQNRQRGLSPMPEELASALSRQELRDLIEFLATNR